MWVGEAWIYKESRIIESWMLIENVSCILKKDVKEILPFFFFFQFVFPSFCIIIICMFPYGTDSFNVVNTSTIYFTFLLLSFHLKIKNKF